jgi:hypothetical protein
VILSVENRRDGLFVLYDGGLHRRVV